MPWETHISRRRSEKDEVAEENKKEDKQDGEQSQENIISWKPSEESVLIFLFSL